MGCGSSKTLAKSVRTREEFLTPLKKKTNGYEEISVPKNGSDQQFITLLCTSNALAISNDASQTKSFNLMASVVEEPEDSDTNIETINSWEMMAGLEDEDEEVEEQRETESSKRCSESPKCGGIERDDAEAMKERGEGEKGLRRKMTATELAGLKVPAMEFSRTGSLRDWLKQGVRPKFGSFERAGESGDGERCEENVFDPDLVAQLERAMEDLTMEEEEVLKQIMEKWEGVSS